DSASEVVEFDDAEVSAEEALAGADEEDVSAGPQRGVSDDRFRAGTDTRPGPPQVTDRVHFSVTAPAVLQAGRAYVLNVWAHLEAQRQAVIERAREAQRGKAIAMQSKGEVAVARGTALTVRLRIPDMVVEDPQDVIGRTG